MTSNIASVAKQVKNSIDWGFVLSNCNPSMKRTITETITRNEELFRLVKEAKEDQPRINFDNYRKLLQSKPEALSFIDSCQESYKSFTPESNPTEKQQLMDAIDKEHQSLSLQTDSFVSKLKERIQIVRTKLSKFDSLNDIDTVTVSNNVY